MIHYPPLEVNDSLPPLDLNDSLPPLDVNDSLPPLDVNDSIHRNDKELNKRQFHTAIYFQNASDM